MAIIKWTIEFEEEALAGRTVADLQQQIKNVIKEPARMDQYEKEKSKIDTAVNDKLDELNIVIKTTTQELEK